MDHPLPSVGSWRTRALILAAVAALELAALVVIAVAALAPTVLGGVEQAVRTHELSPAAPPKELKSSILERTETSVAVLNGNGVSGAAAGTAAKVRALTYVVSGVGNAPRSDYTRSMVMYRGDHRREAKRLAKDLGVKLVGPLDGLRAGDLMGAHLAVIVGR